MLTILNNQGFRFLLYRQGNWNAKKVRAPDNAKTPTFLELTFSSLTSYPQPSSTCHVYVAWHIHEPRRFPGSQASGLGLEPHHPSTLLSLQFADSKSWNFSASIITEANPLLYMCVHECVCVHVCVCAHLYIIFIILLVLFLWRMLTNTEAIVASSE